MNRMTLVAGLIMTCVLAIAACGKSGDAQIAAPEAGADLRDDGAELADLPGDFPRELVPPGYERVDYVDLQQINGTRAVTFESTANVQGAIDHYVDLLGEATINVDSGDGDRMVQWHESPHPPWLVSVMGGADETIVSVATLPKQ